MYFAILNDDGTHEVIRDVEYTEIEIELSSGFEHKITKDNGEDK